MAWQQHQTIDPLGEMGLEEWGDFARDTGQQAVGFLDLASRGRISGGISAYEAWDQSEGFGLGVSERLRYAYAAGRRQAAAVQSLGFSEARDPLAHAKSIAEGLIELGQAREGVEDFSAGNYLEGAGRFFVFGTAVASWVNPQRLAFSGARAGIRVNLIGARASRFTRMVQAPRLRRLMLVAEAGGETTKGGVGPGVVTGLRDESAFSGLRLTGTTRSGTSRLAAEWREAYGPGVMRRHHLVPQELLNDPNFVDPLIAGGYTRAEIEAFVHRQVADIPNVMHVRIHVEGWNATWRTWVKGRTSLSFADVRMQIRGMLREFDVSHSTLGGRRYGR